jgi:hypothetical protein
MVSLAQILPGCPDLVVLFIAHLENRRTIKVSCPRVRVRWISNWGPNEEQYTNP